MANNRVFYPAQSVAIKNNGGALTWTTGHLVHGAQSVGITTNFSLGPTFELGNIELYENVEGIPEVECNMEKVLDGHPLIYHLATTAASDPTLAGRSTSRCDIGLAIYPETNNYASGVPLSVLALSGLYINSIAYAFVTEGGNFSETASFVGNDKIWTRAPGTATGTPNYGETDLGTMPPITWNAHMQRVDSPRATVGVAQSQDLNFDVPTQSGGLSADDNHAVNHPDVTVLPTEIDGISLSGTNNKVSDVYGAHIQTINVSVSLNRENINELGRRGPYARNVTFPTEATAEFTINTSLGDLVSATSNGIFGTGTGLCATTNENLRNRTIRIVTCEGTRIYLGRKNKLASVNYTGGDAGGGNVQVTYGYSTQNTFTVMHQNDPHASGAAWWAARATNGFLVQ